MSKVKPSRQQRRAREAQAKKGSMQSHSRQIPLRDVDSLNLLSSFLDGLAYRLNNFSPDSSRDKHTLILREEVLRRMRLGYINSETHATIKGLTEANIKLTRIQVALETYQKCSAYDEQAMRNLVDVIEKAFDDDSPDADPTDTLAEETDAG